MILSVNLITGWFMR